MGLGEDKNLVTALLDLGTAIEHNILLGQVEHGETVWMFLSSHRNRFMLLSEPMNITPFHIYQPVHILRTTHSRITPAHELFCGSYIGVIGVQQQSNHPIIPDRRHQYGETMKAR